MKYGHISTSDSERERISSPDLDLKNMEELEHDPEPQYPWGKAIKVALTVSTLITMTWLFFHTSGIDDDHSRSLKAQAGLANCIHAFNPQNLNTVAKFTNFPYNRSCGPRAIILGARKGGTTSLFTYISSHPNFHHVKKFYTREEDIIGTKLTHNGELCGVIGSKRYQNKFRNVPDGAFTLDSTPTRLAHEAKRLSTYCPNVPMIVLLRNPIDRCHSQMLMRARFNSSHMSEQSNISKSIERDLLKFRKGKSDSECCNCIREGLYSMHLRKFMDLGMANQFRVYWTSDLKTHTKAVVKDVLGFLGLDESAFDYSITKESFNSAPKKKLRMHQQITSELNKTMRDIFSPHNADLKNILCGDTKIPWT